MARTSSLENISTKRTRIAELAREQPTRVLTTLAHHIDVAWLHAAYDQTRKNGAVGVDGQTGADYAQDLQAQRSTSGSRQA